MHDKERDLMRAFARGRLDRRELLRSAGRLGLGAAAAGYLLNEAQTEALAADFDWQANKGKTVNLLLNKHPYADAMIANLDAFKQLTGMDVKYDVFPEDVYFDKVNAALSSGSDQYDAFMTGAYQTWSYGPAGWIVDLNEFISDSAKTNPNYNWDDVLPNLRASTSWSGVPFAALGGDGAKQWAMPWGFELNSIAYNSSIFDELGIKLAKNLPELVEQAKMITDAGKGVYGIGVRGSRSWATIHPGYLSAFANYGAQDFAVDGRQGQGGDEQRRRQGDDRALGQDDPGGRAEELGHLYLVSGRHRSRRRRLGDDLRCRHPGLLHERRRQQGDGQPRLLRLHPQSGRRGADAQCLDLVAGDGQRVQAEGRRLGVHAVGVGHRARPVRRAQDGLRQPGPRLGLEGRGVPRADRQVLPGLPRAVRRLGPGLEDLLHAAAAVRGGDHRVGGDAAADGGQGGPGRRGPGPAGRPASTSSSSRPASAEPFDRRAPSRAPATSSHPAGSGPMATTAEHRDPAAPEAELRRARRCPICCRCRRCWSASASWCRSAPPSGTRCSATT